MGGWVPLGYAADGRTLAINEAEAETVRRLYSLYGELGSVAALEDAACREGLITKRYEAKTGRVLGGLPFRRGHLYRILANPLYRGAIAHKGHTYEGQHPAIIDEATWRAVQIKLQANGREHRVRGGAIQTNLLAGLLVDERGEALTSTHAVKNGKRYRYYEGQGRGSGQSRWRLPAHVLEAALIGALRSWLTDSHRLSQMPVFSTLPPADLERLFEAAFEWDLRLQDSASEQRTGLAALVERVELHRGGLTIRIRLAALAERLDSTVQHFDLQVPLPLKPHGASSLVLPVPGEVRAQGDPALIKAIARGHNWFEELASGQARSVVEIARRENVTDRYVSCLVKLAILCPRLVERVLAGKVLPGLSAKQLTLGTELPARWADQERLVRGLQE